jgi:ATPase family protein associated with various cellular activities (AAA)
MIRDSFHASANGAEHADYRRRLHVHSKVRNARSNASSRTNLARGFADDEHGIIVTFGGCEFVVDQRGRMQSLGGSPAELIESLRKALDRVLPDALTVYRKQGGNQEQGFGSQDIVLTQHESTQAKRIMESTIPLIEGGRCILLDGKPGVGKTTIAQAIARDAKLGRVVAVDAGLLGSPRESSSSGWVTTSTRSTGEVVDALRMLSPGVLIVDDVDKVCIPLGQLEALRAAARLVVLTANNGQYDEVLDGALMRAGRVDEVFTIEPVARHRCAPFDVLSDEEWEEVSQWPIAYVNELGKRLCSRPDDVRLDDLRQRLTRKTRSGDVLR